MIIKSMFSCKGTTKCLRNLRKGETNKDRQAVLLSVIEIAVSLLNFSEDMKINFKKLCCDCFLGQSGLLLKAPLSLLTVFFPSYIK